MRTPSQRAALAALLALATLAPAIGGCTALVEFNTRAVFDSCVFEDCRILADGTRDCAASKQMDRALHGVDFHVVDIAMPDDVYITSPFENLDELPRLYLCVEPGVCTVATDVNPGANRDIVFSLAGAGPEFDLRYNGGELALAADRNGLEVCSFVRWGADGGAPFEFNELEPDDWYTEVLDVPRFPAPPTIVRTSQADGPAGWTAGMVALGR